MGYVKKPSGYASRGEKCNNQKAAPNKTADRRRVIAAFDSLPQTLEVNGVEFDLVTQANNYGNQEWSYSDFLYVADVEDGAYTITIEPSFDYVIYENDAFEPIAQGGGFFNIDTCAKNAVSALRSEIL